MIDIRKQVVYWRDSSQDDWQVANELIQAGRYRHGLFFTQLALEKILKAHVCLQTQDLAPRIHNLVRLSEIAHLQITQQQIDILAEMNAYNLEGRYPDALILLPSHKQVLATLKRAEEVYRWLMNRLL
jgi:HEPN domain-containing protein